MIRLERINRSFMVGDETVHALRDIDLEMAAGDYLSIMGPSGSGKSTLLNILGLLDQPDSGRYFLQGTETTALNETEQAVARRDHIGFVFQSFHLIPRLTAAQNIELPLMLAGVEPAERTGRVAAVLEQLGLSDRARHRPDQLSGGQRQRVAIARATIMQPALLLADEPTGNLDKHSGDEVVQTLEQLNSRGITLVVVTHDPEIGGRASRRIRMVDGAIDPGHPMTGSG
ncbi:ABC transporter ATP-binding protein [Sedimenticola hydrogenitrophicus]|uniref:ABC transporter ATP-binding protein n=1 Tax=Sedimenticola hydrogenitrophicus TaxID=2967975 RepID=UPI0023B1B58D